MKKPSKKAPRAGKGDKPRNCFSKDFKDNYSEIDWGRARKKNWGKWKKIY
jgi:hypothetical protein